LAREPIPDEVKKAFPNREFVFGREYVIPTPFDHRLIEVLPVAVAKAAMESGCATKKIDDFDAYKAELIQRMRG
jgi:malate dehydrogenase (oxaloacetate-decarboxylating)(NADP+)